MTPKEIKALKWFNDNGPIALFPAGAPSRATRNALMEAKLIEISGREPGQFGFSFFRITDAGREALARN